MREFSKKDFISDLPEDIIDLLLIKLPIRDAVRTSILSTKWRYQWATMTQFVFDENCVRLSDNNRKVTEEELINFIMLFLTLHEGPIHKFKLSTSYWKKFQKMAQWLVCLCTKDIKELVLRAYEYSWWSEDQRILTPSRIFFCPKLTRLKLWGFKVKLPLRFKGFPCLKYLELDSCTVTREVISHLISNCPLLHSLKFKNVDHLALAVRAPNLKVPVTYDSVKFIKLEDINFEEKNQVLYVLHLILRSPNLQQLQISAAAGECTHFKASYLDSWERECSTDFTYKHLKIVEMSGACDEISLKILNFVLGRSPMLEMIRVLPCDVYCGKMSMVNMGGALGWVKARP